MPDHANVTKRLRCFSFVVVIVLFSFVLLLEPSTKHSFDDRLLSQSLAAGMS